ncbi:MAG: acyl CoA:acetate/3-ketoacid CoA transferase subunit beta, partial [Clostridiales Family XIII bacterium]|nr:acyl CoA:acetate/3-ketoacid CoA transferase subunit beta [Clostridiales Family XIII bacterium]
MGMAIKEMMAKRAAEEIDNGNVVNLGFGIPQKVVNYIPRDKTVFLHAENGVLGAGPAPEEGKEDKELIDSGGIPITTVPGAS